MRKVILWFCMAIIAIILIMSGMALQAKTNVSSENEDALSNAISDTVSAMFENKNYTVNNSNEFIADFIEGLTQKIETDADIKVNVLKADAVKGLLSVEVIETYNQPDGSKGEVTCTKTVVFDRKKIINSELKKVEVDYYTSKEDYQNKKQAYKQYTLLEGDAIPTPKVTPEVENNENNNSGDNEQTFSSWYSALSGKQAVFSDADLPDTTGDTIKYAYYAKYASIYQTYGGYNITDWTYTTDEINKTVTLTAYNGGSTSGIDYTKIYIPAKFSINGTDYMTNSFILGGTPAAIAVTKAVIQKGIANIGDSAFNNCTKLISVTIPDSVTSIGSSAFYKVPHIYYTGTATGSPWGALAIN